MSALRRYLVPLFAACMALAAGIALGGGPLATAAGSDDTDTLQASNQALRDELAAVRVGSSFDEAVSEAVAPGLLAGRLADRGVTLVVLPGVQAGWLADTTAAVTQSGGTVTSVVMLDGDVVDPEKKTYVGSVADSSLEGADDVTAPPTGNTYARFGSVVARAYVAHAAATGYDDVAVQIDSELDGAQLVTLAAQPLRRGTLVVVLAPGDHGPDQLTEASQVITTELVIELAKASDGLVVATPATGREEDGILTRLDDEGKVAALPVSTINAGMSPAALVATVEALAAAAAGDPGEFGLVDGRAVLPSGLAPAGD